MSINQVISKAGVNNFFTHISNYEAGQEEEQFKNSVVIDKRLVGLLIDMQDEFVRNGWQREIVPYQIAMIRKLAEHNVPLIVLKLRPHLYGEIVPKLQKEIEKLSSQKVVSINKDSNDGFKETSLLNKLKNLGVKTLLIMGVNADIDACVYQTAETALKKGYKIVTSKQLIAGKRHYSWYIWWYLKNTVYNTEAKNILKRPD